VRLAWDYYVVRVVLVVQASLGLVNDRRLTDYVVQESFSLVREL
jgi:hypothetical protein